MSKVNVLLSTDIGTDIDDAVALYLAMNSPVIDLKGVYVTNGPVKDRARIAKYMLELGGHDALVATGESDAMFTRLSQYTTGAEGFSVPRKKEVHVIDGWFHTMVRQLEEFGDVVIASIAPLTTIAKLLEMAPGAVKNIKEIFIMGGRENHPEHNFSHDSYAASKVLESGLEITIVPADVCIGYQPDIEFLAGLKGSKAQGFLAHMASLWKMYYDNSHVFNMQLSRDVEKLHLMKSDRKVGMKEYDQFERFKMLFMMLCNPINYRDDPVWQLKTARKIIAWAEENPDLPYCELILKKLKLDGMKKTKVSDAFVIYAIEHPEMIKTERVDLLLDYGGDITVAPGSKHKLVREVNYGHFKEYFRKRMTQPMERYARKALAR